MKHVLERRRYTLRDRIYYLAMLRSVTTTLLLGSAIVLNINKTKDFYHPTYIGLSVVIIATYVFSVGYAWWLKGTNRLTLAANLGFGFDALTASVQVMLTGMLESPFGFLFVLVALYGGVVMGRLGGALAGVYAAIGLGLVGAMQANLLVLPWVASWRPEALAVEGIGYRVVTLAGATIGAGLLCGALAERLERTQQDLAASRQSLAQLENLNQRILESLGSGLLTIDLQGHVIYANPAAARLLDREPTAIEGARFVDLGFEGQHQGQDQPVRWEQTLSRAGGTQRILGLSATPLLGLSRERLGDIVTFQDLTDLRRTEEALQQRERLATLGRFAAKIAHEIRNPLTSISGAAEMLSASAVQDDDRLLMEIVQREADRLNSLLRQILDFAKPRPLQRRPLVLAQLVEEAALLFRHQLPSTVQLALDLAQEVICDADAEALQQVILNLWGNSADALSAKGGGEIRTRVRREGPWAILQVSDTGDGIPSEAKDHIFEPFFTMKSKGTGLGLATVHQLVSEHGGHIALDPTPAGQGASFRVSLPAAAEVQGISMQEEEAA